jgi:hypothetical protein
VFLEETYLRFEEHRTGKPGENGFPELNFNVDDLVRLEEFLATNSRSILAGERLGHDPVGLSSVTVYGQ